MFTVFGTLILFHGLLFWYAAHENNQRAAITVQNKGNGNKIPR